MPPLASDNGNGGQAAREQQQQQPGHAMAGQLLRRELGCGWDRCVDFGG